MPNLATVLGLRQLNAAVIYMILTKRRNYWEKEQAVAKAVAKAVAEAAAKARAEDQAWFEAWQKDPEQAPPPPWARNGQEKE